MLPLLIDQRTVLGTSISGCDLYRILGHQIFVHGVLIRYNVVVITNVPLPLSKHILNRPREGTKLILMSNISA